MRANICPASRRVVPRMDTFSPTSLLFRDDNNSTATIESCSRPVGSSYVSESGHHFSRLTTCDRLAIIILDGSRLLWKAIRMACLVGLLLGAFLSFFFFLFLVVVAGNAGLVMDFPGSDCVLSSADGLWVIRYFLEVVLEFFVFFRES